MLVFLLGIVFSTVAPVICPFVFAYFVVAYGVGRYQLLYVFMPK